MHDDLTVLECILQYVSNTRIIPPWISLEDYSCLFTLRKLRYFIVNQLRARFLLEWVDYRPLRYNATNSVFVPLSDRGCCGRLSSSDYIPSVMRRFSQLHTFTQLWLDEIDLSLWNCIIFLESLWYLTMEIKGYPWRDLRSGMLGLAGGGCNTHGLSK